MPYKLVMGKLSKPSPIPEINIPGRVETIVCELFPTHQKRPKDEWPASCNQEVINAAIQLDEIKSAACSLRSNTAPGKMLHPMQTRHPIKSIQHVPLGGHIPCYMEISQAGSP